MILADDELTNIHNSIATSGIDNVKQRIDTTTRGSDIEQIQIEEAKYAKDALIERAHELQEEQELLKVLKTRPNVLQFQEIKEEEESCMEDSLKTDTELALEESSHYEESKDMIGHGVNFLGSPRDSQPSA